MARIPILREDDRRTPAETRRLLQKQKAKLGRLHNITRVMANDPAALAGFRALSSAVYRGNNLTRIEAELAYSTATVINGCYY